jgi:ABC-type sugar transport system substrate-binding protein
VIGSTGSYAQEKTIGVSFDRSSPFRSAQHAAIEKAIKDAGAKMSFADANLDVQRQVSQLDTMVSEGVSAIIAIPYDAQAAVGMAQSAIASGVPFISMDQAPADLKAATYHVGGDPCADGTTAGEFFAKAAGGKPFKLLEIQGGLFNDNGLRRSKCLDDTLARYPNVKIVAQVPTDWSPEKALVGTENTLQAHPDLNGIYTPWNDGLQGVFSALRTRNLLVPVDDPKHIVQVSIDGTPLACEAVRNGLLDLDIATPIAEMAKRAVEAAMLAADGGTPKSHADFLPGIPYGRNDVKEKAHLVWGC